MIDQGEKIAWWLSHLGHLMTQFKGKPDTANLLFLVETLKEYREDVESGLMPAFVPIGEPVRRAATLADWLLLQIDVAYRHFLNSPREDRFESLVEEIVRYQDEAAVGRIRP